MHKPPFTFFGSSRFSVIVLGELAVAGLVPARIVSTPDRPKGRGLVMTPAPAKEWGLAHGIPVLSPEKLDAAFVAELGAAMRADGPGAFALVASYGKIIPQGVLDLAPDRFLNIHPSLLPKYRGASPLQSAMLDDAKQTGVTLMVMDAAMDHGPLIAQEKVDVAAQAEWSGQWPTYEAFEAHMAKVGAHLLAHHLASWSDGSLVPRAQDHAAATFTKKISKEDALIDLAGDPYAAFLKIQAFHEWPKAHFIIEKNGKPLRIKVAAASYADGKLSLERVIPEGSKEMAYADYVRGYAPQRS